MHFQDKYHLKNIINARGVFTPLGVSRSSEHVANATASALKHYFDISELQNVAGNIIADHCGAEFATVTNCASAGITLSIAAAMTGQNMSKISRLPDASKMNNKIVICAGHLVDYGHPVEQDIRLSGGTVVIAGDEKQCTIPQLQSALEISGVAALLHVESRLTQGENPDINSVINIAHANKIPVVSDAAAQDMRMNELVSSGAELINFSAQKYLAAPTAGIVVGKRKWVEAVRAQEKGIGRAMKAGKEAIIGTLAAIEDRNNIDMQLWSQEKYNEAQEFANIIERNKFLSAELEKDPSKGEFWRVEMKIDEIAAGLTATEVAQNLQNGDPAIYCNNTKAYEGILNFELLSLSATERDTIVQKIFSILDQAKNTRS